MILDSTGSSVLGIGSIIGSENLTTEQVCKAPRLQTSHKANLINVARDAGIHKRMA